MSFNFDIMNNKELQLDLNTEEDAENETKSSVDDIPEIKEWREDDLTDEQKGERIEERRGKIDYFAKEFGFDMKKSVEKVKKELAEKYENYAKMEGDLDKVQSGNIEDGAEEGLKEMKRVLSSLSGIYESQLQIEYLEYIKEYEKDLENPELLLESHAKRNLLMNNWETLIEGMRADLKETETDEGEAMRKWARWVKEHPEIALLALAALVVAGIAIAVLLTPEIIAALPAMPGMPEIVFPAIKEGGAVVAKMFAGAGAVAGLGRVLSWFSKEENRDKVAEGIFGAKIPAIAYLFNGRPSERKTG